MDRTGFVAAVADRMGVSKEKANVAVGAVIESISAALIEGDGNLQLKGFGSFSTPVRAARVARHIRTGAVLNVPARVVVKFKASPVLVAGLNV